MRVDPKLVADQQGHTVDVNRNVYTQTSIDERLRVIEALASELVNQLKSGKDRVKI